MNNILIFLIPKIKGDFTPIFLCNVLYKIVSKTIENILKGILSYITVSFQRSFVVNRIIMDNVIQTFERFHVMKHMKGKKGMIGLKLDMSQTHD